MSKTWINEVEDTYKDHRYVVKLQQLGHRCGYIEILPDECVDENYLEVHGGITFRDVVTPDDDTDYLPVGVWIGFDCAHIQDTADVDATMNAFGTAPGYVNRDPGSVVRSLQYCIDECRSVIDQIVEQ